MNIINPIDSQRTFSTQNLFAKKTNTNDCPNLLFRLQQYKRSKFNLWRFYLKGSNELIAVAGVCCITLDDYQEIELLFFQNKRLERGIAVEVVKACVDLAFNKLSLDNLICLVSEEDQSLRSVIEEVGFCDEFDLSCDASWKLSRLKKPLSVSISTYNAKWPELFLQEAGQIQNALGDHLKEICHIGSTSIPGMLAKPVIDLLLVCENLDDIKSIAEKLNDLDYPATRKHVVPHRGYFMRKQLQNYDYHLHIRERGDPQIRRHINFRDYLCEHEQDAKAYASLKCELARKHNTDRSAYVLGKDKFVQDIDALANRWPQRRKDYLSPNTGVQAKDWSLDKLTKAMDANLNVNMTHFAQYLNQVELIRIPIYTLVNSGLQDDTFNYVLAADLLPNTVDSAIRSICQLYGEKDVPFSWWVGPYSKPDDLTDHLERHGFVNTESNIAMYFDLDEWDGVINPLPELDIIQAKDEKTLRDFALVLANDKKAFTQYFSWIAAVLSGDDPIEYYVGYVNGTPVVRGLSCYFAQVAGLHWLSTADNERKKGYGAAMQYHRLKRAKELGYHIAVLQASEQGYSLYRKLGYKECGVYKEYKLK